MKLRTMLGCVAVAVTALTTAGLTTGAASATVNPYKTVKTHQRHARDLRKVNVTIPGTRLPSLQITQPAGTRYGIGSAQSTNWSGYADVACPTCALRYVSADFTVPHLNLTKSSDGAVAGHWVGLDGWGSTTVEQVGIDTEVQNGVDKYYAWFEMFPAPTQVWALAASPGDNIQVSVYTVNGTYYLSLNDTTLGAGFDATATLPTGYTGRNHSAEVITEAPSQLTSTGSLAQVPLADYGQVNYNNATVTSRSGIHGGLGTGALWNGYALKMVNGTTGAALSTPSGLLSGTNGSGIPVSDFTATWQAAN